MINLVDHLVILPIVIPLVAGALMLLVPNQNHQFKRAISILSCSALLVVTILLIYEINASHTPFINAYHLGNWQARFGISLVADRLSIMMVTLTSILAFPVVLFSLNHWSKVGVYFLPLLQFLLMGLNGAFLTGDLFNLFVFFEVLLAASYGLVLQASDFPRVKAGMQYIVINLVASSFFLIGISVIYSACDALNMADISARIAALPIENRMPIHIGFSFLLTAFLVKAGAWPLCFWLPRTYFAVSSPVAAIFAIMTKVGVYALLRMMTLFFGVTAGAIFYPGWNWVLFLGLATLLFGSIGALASQDTKHLATFCVLISSGTLLAAIGHGDAAVIAGALYYLVSSTIAIAAFFLLIELMERGQEAGADILAVTREAYSLNEEDEKPLEEEEKGLPIPATLAILGLSFVACALIIAGLPPFSGFIGKFALLSALFNPFAPSGKTITFADGFFAFLLFLSGLSALIALSRAGIRTFWPSFEQLTTNVRALEIIPIILLLTLNIVLTVQAGPLMQYMGSTARYLRMPQNYIETVLTPNKNQNTPEGNIAKEEEFMP